MISDMNCTMRPQPESGLKIDRTDKAKGLNIIGISCGYHDSACALVREGSLVSAAQEERFSRVKNDKSFPEQAFRYCIEQSELTISDIDCIAYYENPTLKLGRQLWMGLLPDIPKQRHYEVFDRLASLTPKQIIETVLGYEGPIEHIEHHHSHAASSYYFSGFEDAAILTVDGVGEWSTTSYGYADGAKLDSFEQVDFPDSLGFFYSAITDYLGFEVNEGEYKVMGLAPYGRPRYVNEIRQLVSSCSDGQYRLDLKYFSFLYEDRMYSEELCRLLDHKAREPETEIQEFHMDVAKSVQVVLEEILLTKVAYLHDRVGSDNLCMAGGVALNVVANSRILKEGRFKRLFVPPAAGDAGGAIGAAAAAYVRLTGTRPSKRPLTHAFFGPSNSPAEVYQLLKGSSVKFQDYRDREKELIEHCTECLLHGKILGWCQGRMEFGPRALGSRSILADPRRPEMRDKINAVVKMREWFRPFAPAVLESETQKHFEIDHPSPFMLETCKVISSIAMPAITHVDGSARIQTVRADINPRFTALLDMFYQRTGCPILLNTSFNMRGEPIVCSALDAISCFVQSQIDVLVLEDFVIDRSDIPQLWAFYAQMTPVRRPGAAVGHRVYTML
jgi:carbamoyltransferase